MAREKKSRASAGRPTAAGKGKAKGPSLAQDNTKADPGQSVQIPGLVSAVSLVREMSEVRWLWESWLPRGMITLLVGSSGVGKSLLALSLVKSVVTPSQWPGGGTGPSQPGTTVWIDTEASQSILASRLDRWGLPLDRIYTIGQSWTDATINLSSKIDRERIRYLVMKARPDLVVIDSLAGSHSGRENSTGAMVKVLGFLAELARDSGAAILVVHHLRKAKLGESEIVNLDRIRGSSATGSLSRVVISLSLVAGTLQMRAIKSNVGLLPKPLSLTITDTGITFANATENAAKTPQQTAEDFLRKALANGPKGFKDLMPEADKIGISKRQLYDAKERLGSTTHRKQWELKQGAICPKGK